MSSAEIKPIIFYDIPSIVPGRPCSPNTMKTRYCLTYKQLPFTTVWVELPDIAGLLQSKGIKQPPYTLPTIEDPNTGSVIVDSLAIATYLDDTYPETPKVLSPAGRAALERFGGLLSLRASASGTSAENVPVDTPASDLAARLVFPILAAGRLSTASREYYHRARAADFGDAELWKSLCEACAASPEARAQQVRQGIDAIRGAWHNLTAVYEGEGDRESGASRGPFVLGEEPSFLDFAIAGIVKFIRDVLLPSEVEIIKNMEGGRLMSLEESLEKYYKY